jgi:hypothetical protein
MFRRHLISMSVTLNNRNSIVIRGSSIGVHRAGIRSGNAGSSRFEFNPRHQLP